jgi:Rieske Fe-S protein
VVLAGGAAGALALSGCATYGGSGDRQPPPPEPNPAPPSPTDGGGDDTGGDDGGGADGGGADPGGASPLAGVTDVPVGGGLILSAAGVVITQPTAGDFQAFSAVCTHQSCTVGQVRDGTIECPCHGSRFDMVTGAVVTGPATAPLPPVPITVDGDAIALA